MGNCICNKTLENQDEKIKNKEIEKQIEKDKKTFEREIKLLLLGAGESGKSTIAKQMRIIYLKGFSAEEKLKFKDIIYSNIIYAMKSLIEGAKKLHIPFENKNENLIKELESLTEIPNDITEEFIEKLKKFWADEGIQQTFQRQNEFQLFDSTEYYYKDLDRILNTNYIPNEQDILRSRVKTTGIIETEFDVDGVHFRMVDVGGQRSERKKWIHCFQDVTAVVFCVAMSEYDLKLYEDDTVNRMDESLKLFDEICNSKWFSQTPIILFLNKNDIFKEKIKKIDLKVCFPHYKGGLNYERAVSYIKKKFIKLNKSETRKEIYCHVTCATDTENITFVFNVVKDIVIKKALIEHGIL